MLCHQAINHSIYERLQVVRWLPFILAQSRQCTIQLCSSRPTYAMNTVDPRTRNKVLLNSGVANLRSYVGR